MALLLIPTVPIVGQQKREIRVAVNIAADEVVKNQFVSKVNSALRSLGDVVVVNSDYRYRISLVILSPGPDGGRQTGYVASIVVQEIEMSKDAINRLVDKEVQDGASSSILKHNNISLSERNTERIRQACRAEIDRL